MRKLCARAMHIICKYNATLITTTLVEKKAKHEVDVVLNVMRLQ